MSTRHCGTWAPPNISTKPDSTWEGAANHLRFQMNSLDFSSGRCSISISFYSWNESAMISSVLRRSLIACLLIVYVCGGRTWGRCTSVFLWHYSIGSILVGGNCCQCFGVWQGPHKVHFAHIYAIDVLFALFGFYNKIDTIEIRKKYRLLSRSQFVCCCRIRAVAMQRISFSRRCRFFFQFLIQIDRNRIGSIPKPHMMRVTASCTTRTVYARATFSLNCFILIRLRSIAISVSDIVNRPTSLFFSPATIPTCNWFIQYNCNYLTEIDCEKQFIACNGNDDFSISIQNDSRSLYLEPNAVIVLFEAHFFTSIYWTLKFFQFLLYNSIGTLLMLLK